MDRGGPLKTPFVPWLASVVLAVLSIVSLPSVQRSLIPMEDAMDRMILESLAKPDVAGLVTRDIVYQRGLLRNQRLDLYAPLHNGEAWQDGAPLVIFLHGGSWIHGDKATIRVIDRFLRRMREDGYAVAAVNYTTGILRGLRGPAKNVSTAVEWLADNADEFGLDTKRVGLYGVSAGGHLALVEASRLDRSGPEFRFVFAECAPSDLVALYREAFANSRLLGLFGYKNLERLSPINLISRNLPPVLVLHGGKDQVVHVDQSIRYAAALEAQEMAVELHLYPDGDHGFLNLPDEVWFEQESIALEYFARGFE